MTWFFQVQQITSSSGGIDPLVVTLAGAVLTSLTMAIGVLWRQSVAESKRKDELIDRLLSATEKAAAATEKSVEHAERRERAGRTAK